MFEAKVTVMLRKSVLDPQGAAIERAISSGAGDGLSFPDIASVRVGKVFELRVRGENASAVERQVSELADRILANPVMEEYSVSVEKVS